MIKKQSKFESPEKYQINYLLTNEEIFSLKEENFSLFVIILPILASNNNNITEN